MKKLLLLSTILGSIAIFPHVASAKTNTAAAIGGQVITVGIGQPGRRWRGGRSVIRTRIVSRYGRRYRETYRISYLPGGRTRVQVISRTQIGGGRRIRY